MTDQTTAELAADAESFKADYLSACKTIADMHAAATGRRGEAPTRGVIEDVEDVRQRAERAETRLRLAHQARRAKEHQLDDVRRALCDIGFMEDDDPYSHADLAEVIRQNGAALREVGEVDGSGAVDLAAPAPATDDAFVPRALFEENARRHQGAIARVDELLAVIERVRALHQPQPDGTGFDDGQQCRTCSQVGGDGYQYLVPWPCPTVRALDEPVPAATGAADLETTARVLSALHRSAEGAVTRVINLHEQWVAAGPPPLGAPLACWWDARLAELHQAIQPADQTTEK